MGGRGAHTGAWALGAGMTEWGFWGGDPHKHPTGGPRARRGGGPTAAGPHQQWADQRQRAYITGRGCESRKRVALAITLATNAFASPRVVIAAYSSSTIARSWGVVA